ncbi:hypothetical protein H0H92_006164 [Tricholoma furcatifolium]|nr:hypothetical protein H0H92_006164 [Tricholoma furcatifolium]
MATTTENVQAQPTARGAARRGGKARGGGSQNRGGRGKEKEKTPVPAPSSAPELTEHGQEKTLDDGDAAGDSDMCWICAEPVKYHSVSECNHRTCHVCALRLRALYKKLECTFCKEPQPSVIFTASPDEPYSSYTLDSMQFKDAKLSIYFETQEMMEETLLLLRFNCPDPDCPYIGNGWGDLKLHVRATHGKLMCDLCIRSKKVFAHEHALYPPNLLPQHLPSLYHRTHGKTVPKDQIEGGIHPLCEFCRECFFGDDELYSHMRERHEECFVCKRNEIRDQYFQNYESLEAHFNKAHHPCTQSECLSRKFVVFNTPLDLQAHMVDEHGSGMSTRDKKDARRVQADFEFEEVGTGGRHGRRGGAPRERGGPPSQRQAPPEPAAPPPSAVVARPPGPGRRREAFGASLTTEGRPSPPSNVTPDHSRPPSPPRGDMDPEALQRQEVMFSRLQSFASNPATAVPVVTAATRGFRASESSAKDLISTIWNVLDHHLEHTASIVNAFVDLLDSEDKKQDLLSSWRGFEIERRREFPDLIPSAIAASGTAGYAAITTGRVLNAKHVTATRSSKHSSRQVWDRVAQAASSGPSFAKPTPKPAVENFPTLASSSGAGPSQTPFRQGQRSTPWSASGSSNPPPPPSSMSMPTPAQASSSHLTILPSKPQPGRSGPRAPPPKLSNAAFPELPSSAPTRTKAPVKGNVSLQNILGNPTPPSVPAWSSGPGASATESPAVAGSGEDSGGAPSAGKGKKGKGKQKQTLFTLGSFPT